MPVEARGSSITQHQLLVVTQTQKKSCSVREFDHFFDAYIHSRSCVSHDDTYSNTCCISDPGYSL